MERYVRPVLRHELYHAGYAQIRASSPLSQIMTLCGLTQDLARRLRMEGGAILLSDIKGRGGSCRTEKAYIALGRYAQFIESRMTNANVDVGRKALDAYFPFERTAGLYTGSAGRSASGMPPCALSAECMRMEPQVWLEKARALAEPEREGAPGQPV